MTLWDRHAALADALFASQRRRARAAPFFVVAGLNVVSDGPGATAAAAAVRDAAHAAGVPALFKASWDKANRTSVDSYRGLAPARAARALACAARAARVPLLTDIHEAHHAPRAARFAHALQIPALLCRQTDLVQAAARTGRALNIKKGQFASPAVVVAAVEKARLANPDVHVMVTERGACFGHGALVVDLTALRVLRSARVPVVIDATHAAQVPPHGDMRASSGSLADVRAIARGAVAAGVDGVFLEVHDRPTDAPCDSAVQMPTHDLEPFLRELVAIARASRALDDAPAFAK